jgi:ribonuclease HII
LSVGQRQVLAKRIYETAWFIGLGQASVIEIDKLGLTMSTTMAMRRALVRLPKGSHIIIDGPFNFLKKLPNVSCQVKADNTEPAVMAAAIIAKQKRDQLMEAYAQRWPVYGFDRHVGYGTAKHKAALDSHGVCELHRLSFKPVAELQALSL